MFIKLRAFWKGCRRGAFQNLWLLLALLLVVVVILESCSPGSVVIKKEENNGFWTETFQNDLNFINNKFPSPARRLPYRMTTKPHSKRPRHEGGAYNKTISSQLS